MFSKKITLFVSFLFLTVQLTACDRFLNSSKDKEDQEEKISIETSQELACLKEISPKFKRFFEDKANNSDLPESVACLQNSLKTFMKYTTGNDAGFYTGKEIQHFFNRYLLKDNQISDDFQVDIMKAKVIFVGGSSDTFTRAELESFIQFMGIFGGKLQSLKDKMKMMVFRKKQGEVSAAEINKAQTAVQELIIFFIEQSKITSSKYELNDLITLVENLDKFIGKEDNIQQAFKWIPIIKEVKKLFMGESADLTTATEWKNAFSWTGDAYFQVLKFHYLVKDLEYNDPLDWNILMAWTDDLLKLIATSPEMKQQKLLEALKIDSVIKEVYALDLFKTDISQDLAKSTYRKMIAYILNRSVSRDSETEVTGLSLQNLNVIAQEYHVWRLSQQFLVDTFSKAKRAKVILNTKNLQNEFNKYDYKKVIDSFQVSPVERDELIQSWKDVRGFLFTTTPIVADGKGKLRMQHGLPDLENTMAGGNMLNSSRSYIRIIMRGYAEKKEKYLFQNSVPKQSFLNLEKDFREFAQKMGFIDPRNLSPAARTFTEANFLTYNGDGNELMSPTEAVQLLGMMFSGGKAVTKELFEDLEKVNKILIQRNQKACFTGEIDIFGQPVVSEPCFKVIYKKNMGRYFESMPNTQVYLTFLTDSQFEEWYRTIMIPAAIEKHRPGLVEYSEARSINVIMHYIESLMIVFDKDKDQMLSEQELVAAMPRFEDFIKKMSPLGDWFVSDIFLFMVYKGEKPTVGPLVKFKLERAQGLGKVSRLNIIKVLALLKAQAKEDAAKAAQAQAEN